MFTVKLMKLNNVLGDNRPGLVSTKIVEATEVDVHTLRPNELIEISGVRPDSSSFAFYVSDRNEKRPEGFAEDVPMYYSAYVENAAGATTHIVRV